MHKLFGIMDPSFQWRGTDLEKLDYLDIGNEH
jgi:hypothetical protein